MAETSLYSTTNQELNQAPSRNPQFFYHKAPQEYETLTFPTHILYDPTIEGNAVKLLLIMYDFGKRPNWVLNQKHLMRQSNMKWDKYTTAIQQLVDAGYVERFRPKIPGCLSSYCYRFSIFPVFKSSLENDTKPPHIESEPVGIFPTGKSYQENPTITPCSDLTPCSEKQQTTVVVFPDEEQKREALDQFNFPEEVLIKLLSIGIDQIFDGIKAFEQYNENQHLLNPLGALRKAIVQGWKPNITQKEISQQRARKEEEQKTEIQKNKTYTEEKLSTKFKEGYSLIVQGLFVTLKDPKGSYQLEYKDEDFKKNLDYFIREHKC